MYPRFLKNLAASIYLQGYTGNYSSWKMARQHSKGYNAPNVLEAAIAGTQEIRKNGSAYHSWPLLFALMKAAVANNGHLSVLDFGGALGTIYHRDRSTLQPLSSIRWSVVEQPSFVKAGREIFQNNELFFYYTTEECLEHERINTVLLSGVLQYLPDPHKVIDEIALIGISNVIIDRTPFILGHDRLTVQHVLKPRSSYSWSTSEDTKGY